MHPGGVPEINAGLGEFDSGTPPGCCPFLPMFRWYRPRLRTQPPATLLHPFWMPCNPPRGSAMTGETPVLLICGAGDAFPRSPAI